MVARRSGKPATWFGLCLHMPGTFVSLGWPFSEMMSPHRWVTKHIHFYTDQTLICSIYDMAGNVASALLSSFNPPSKFMRFG